jgi:hypothetical protein
MLTHQQINVLENAWEILDKLRNCKDFNESHDLTISDGCRVLSDFLDYQHDKEHSTCTQEPAIISFASLEAFNNF